MTPSSRSSSATGRNASPVTRTATASPSPICSPTSTPRTTASTTERGAVGDQRVARLLADARTGSRRRGRGRRRSRSRGCRARGRAAGRRPRRRGHRPTRRRPPAAAVDGPVGGQPGADVAAEVQVVAVAVGHRDHRHVVLGEGGDGVLDRQVVAHVHRADGARPRAPPSAVGSRPRSGRPGPDSVTRGCSRSGHRPGTAAPRWPRPGRCRRARAARRPGWRPWTPRRCTRRAARGCRPAAAARPRCR